MDFKFIPAPGQVLLEKIEEENPLSSKNESISNTARKAKVLKTGMDYVNQFGVKQTSPCEVGDIVIYEEVPNMPNPIYTHQFKDYPIVIFQRILGVIK